MTTGFLIPLSLAMGLVGLAAFFWALRSEEMTATAANLIVQIQTPVAILLDWLVMRERFDARKAFGTAIAVLGVGIVIGLPAEAPGLLP